jgi:hypothetical protein
LTIFGPPWDELSLAHVQSYLDEADDEPLLWEAKGTKLKADEVRRQVCAFANSHEGGYLILGAEKAVGEDNVSSWVLPGVPFPDEPIMWVTNVVSDLEAGVRPRPDFDVRPWEAPNGHVAVVRVAPTSTPPCITNGTVYERLPGKSQTVRDPARLAELFSRGDDARRAAAARADRAAQLVMNNWLEGDPDVFGAQPEPEEALPEDDSEHIRFAVGVAATGNSPDTAGRLFQADFAEAIQTRLRERAQLPGLPAGVYSGPPAYVFWSQDALTWRHRATGLIDATRVVRAASDGSAAAGEVVATEDVLPKHFADIQLAPAWRLADQLLERLGGFGDVYVTVLIAGGRFRMRRDRGRIVIRRGPLLPGVEDDHVASVGT